MCTSASTRVPCVGSPVQRGPADNGGRVGGTTSGGRHGAYRWRRCSEGSTWVNNGGGGATARSGRQETLGRELFMARVPS